MSDAREVADMPAEVDFSESIPSPYAVDYFKDESRRTGVPYQTIMNLHLGRCAAYDEQSAAQQSKSYISGRFPASTQRSMSATIRSGDSMW